MKKPVFAIVLLMSVIGPLSFAHGEMLLVYSENSERDVFRANTVTGEAFVLRTVEDPVPRWIPIKETDRVEASDYKFVVVVTRRGTRIIRMDSRTGESWIAGLSSAWRKMLEP